MQHDFQLLVLYGLMRTQAYSTESMIELGKKRLKGKAMPFREWKRRYPDSPTAHTIQLRFGTWNNFLTAVGAQPRPYGLKYTTQELLEPMRKVLAETGRAPTTEEWDAKYKPHSRRILRHFGTWTKAWKRAGATKRQLRRGLSGEKLVERLRETYEEYGRPLSIQEWQRKGRTPDPKVFQLEFGSWDKAWKQALKKPGRK
jgi:hypothetical protein